VTDREKLRARRVRYEESEKGRARKVRYDQSQKGRATKARSNERRLFASGMYLGMVGFTKREREELVRDDANLSTPCFE